MRMGASVTQADAFGPAAEDGRMATAAVNGIELYYERMGKGPRLVLTHGAWGDGRSWQGVVESLSRRFEVVTWDRRGHSRSSDGEGPGSRLQDAADLAALIQHLGPEPAHVCGNSAGSSVTLTLVTERPELVRSAVVHEPALYGLLLQSGDAHVAERLADDLRVIDEVRQLIERRDHEAATRAFVELALGRGMWDRLPAETRASWTANADTFYDESRAPAEMWNVDVEALASSQIPLLVTYGTDSPELERVGTQELIRRLPAARVEVLEGAGHVPYRTHPEAWMASLVSFLDITDRAPVAGRPG
jgi:pimeloyl-ACP methyl ester carboxylesterase